MYHAHNCKYQEMKQNLSIVCNWSAAYHDIVLGMALCYIAACMLLGL